MPEAPNLWDLLKNSSHGLTMAELEQAGVDRDRTEKQLNDLCDRGLVKIVPKDGKYCFKLTRKGYRKHSIFLFLKKNSRKIDIIFIILLIGLLIGLVITTLQKNDIGRTIEGLEAKQAALATGNNLCNAIIMIDESHGYFYSRPSAEYSQMSNLWNDKLGYCVRTAFDGNTFRYALNLSDAIFLVNPSKELSQDEISQLDRYMQNGGVLVVAIEPTHLLNPLLNKYGMDAPLAQPLADDMKNKPGYPCTSVFSVPVSGEFCSNNTRSVQINQGTAILKKEADVEILAATENTAFIDKNRNCQIDPDEKRDFYPVALRKQVGAGYLIAIGDASMFDNDHLLGDQNLLFLTGILSKSLQPNVPKVTATLSTQTALNNGDEFTIDVSVLNDGKKYDTGKVALAVANAKYFDVLSNGGMNMEPNEQYSNVLIFSDNIDLGPTERKNYHLTFRVKNSDLFDWKLHRSVEVFSVAMSDGYLSQMSNYLNINSEFQRYGGYATLFGLLALILGIPGYELIKKLRGK